MKTLFVLIALAFSVSFANAQSPTRLCIQNGNNCVDVGNSNPLPVDGGAGSSGTPTQTPINVTNSSTALVTAGQFNNFFKVCVSLTASTGIWVDWSGAAAVTAAPSEYMPPGQCDIWIKSSGFLVTSAVNAISNSSGTIAVSLIGN